MTTSAKSEGTKLYGIFGTASSPYPVIVKGAGELRVSPEGVLIPAPSRAVQDSKSRPSVGCICPPGANLQCENPACPRKDPMRGQAVAR
jgi:hypothetical protein